MRWEGTSKTADCEPADEKQKLCHKKGRAGIGSPRRFGGRRDVARRGIAPEWLKAGMPRVAVVQQDPKKPAGVDSWTYT